MSKLMPVLAKAILEAQTEHPTELAGYVARQLLKVSLLSPAVHWQQHNMLGSIMLCITCNCMLRRKGVCTAAKASWSEAASLQAVGKGGHHLL